MATGKRLFWIKLTMSFLTSDKVDYLLSQKNGANYVVIYQMLCLKTLNNDGVLGRYIGEVLIPYDAEKIQRDLKHFDIDTIRVALNLYHKLGMIYEQEDGLLKISELNELVGSETDYASQKRIQRIETKKLDYGHSVDNGVDNVHIDIEYRDRERDRDKKHIYGTYKHIKLTEKELDSLTKEYGSQMVGKFINYLDEYIEMKGAKYKSHYLVIKKWVIDAVLEKEDKQASKERKQYVSTDIKPNYEQINTEVDTSNLDNFLKERSANV